MTFFTGLAVISLVVTAALTIRVFSELDELGNATQDDIQWTMAQLEVDHLKLINAIDDLDAAQDSSIIRTRDAFDIFFSRANILRFGQLYQDVLSDPATRDTVDHVWDVIDKITPVIDGDNAPLAGRKAELISELQRLYDPLSRLSARGIELRASRADAQKGVLTTMLMQLTIVSLVMLIGLVSLVILFWQLYRNYRRRALENRTTLNRLRTILDTSQDAILVVGEDGAIHDINGAAKTVFGLEPKSGHSLPAIEKLLFRREPDGSITPITGPRLVASCTDGPNICAKISGRRSDGQEFPVELSANMAARSGEPVCVCFVSDITQRVVAEKEIRAAQEAAMAGERAKARFLAVISHEMRTPLNGILGSLDLLDQSPMSKDQRVYTEIMKSSGQILLSQISDALDATQADGRQFSLTQSQFNLDELLDDLLLGQARDADAQNTRLELDTGGSHLGHVEGDRGRLYQVLLNLVSNAIKYTHDGEVTVAVTRLGTDASPSDLVEFQVVDTGIGIDEADCVRIFDDFVRLEESDKASAPGTGLGLGIARQLVTLLGGEMGVESVKDEGSLFWVRVPLPVAADKVEQTATDSADQDVPSRSVLIVEDNDTNRFVLSQMLVINGHCVDEATNGAEAVDRANAKAYDTIIMDINMPVMDGLEATRLIRVGGGASASSRIIALTAHFQPEQADLMSSAGFDEIQIKPLRFPTLRTVLAGNSRSGTRDKSSTFLDATVLSQLSEALSEDDLAPLIERFLEEGESLVESLGNASSDEPSNLVEQLHAFAGSAATFGALALKALLGRAEEAALSGETERLQSELSQLAPLWSATRAALQARRPAA